MIEIDFLKVAAGMEAQGVKGRIYRLVKQAAKNVANGRSYRLINKLGSVIEINGVKSIVTNQGKLCQIA